MTESKTARKSMVKSKDGSEVEMTLEYALKELRIVTASGLSIQKNSTVVMLLQAYDESVKFGQNTLIQLRNSEQQLEQNRDAYDAMSGEYNDMQAEMNTLRIEIASLNAELAAIVKPAIEAAEAMGFVVPAPKVIMATYPGEEHSPETNNDHPEGQS